MKGFTKLFQSIITSSIWREPDHVRLVWVTMMALCDESGEVWASVGGLADAARVTREQCLDALRVLESPDEDSRTKDHDGRRIETIDGGWFLLNYHKYRAYRDPVERREQVRHAVQRHRDARKNNAGPVINVINVSQSNPNAEAEAEAEVEAAAAPPSRKTAAAAPYEHPFDPSPNDPSHVSVACDRRSFADWRIAVGHRVFVSQDERAEWLALYAAEGWDEMSKAYAYLNGQHPDGKLFLSQFQEMR
jgi:hypothetical protein